MSPHISLNELYNIQRDKQKNKTLCFDKILELCHRRIRNVASYNGLNTFYEIPGLLVGYPLFDVRDCLEYLVKSLRRSGFLVQILPPPHMAVVYISWDPAELEERRPSLPQPAARQVPAPQRRLRLF
jgi:Family of unknown function (DUF5759)